MPTDSETPADPTPANPALRRRLVWIGVAAVVTTAGGWWLAGEFAAVRNYSLHASLANEARQISSAANQCFEEQKRDAVPLREIGRFVNFGPSGGKQVSVDGVHFQSCSYKDMRGEITRSGVFYVGHPDFSKTGLTRHPACKAAGGPDFAMKFSVESGAPVP